MNEKTNLEQNIEQNNEIRMSDLTDTAANSYVKLSDKYEDIKSSAYTMLIVGGVGLIFMILVIADVINLPLNPSSSWLFYTVMGGIFIIFVIAGIVSAMHAKQVKIDADAEDKLIDEIMEWANDNISKEYLDEGLDLTTPEEILYFSRADKIKDKLMHAFENADEPLINELTEQLYQKMYE